MNKEFKDIGDEQTKDLAECIMFPHNIQTHITFILETVVSHLTHKC